MRKIFRKFLNPFKGGRNAAGEKGIGLGLSLVKEVVDLHAGKIWCKASPKRGAGFQSFYPLEKGSEERGVRWRPKILQIFNIHSTFS